jgi:tetratricopeptide (TPR) repeat protein
MTALSGGGDLCSITRVNGPATSPADPPRTAPRAILAAAGVIALAAGAAYGNTFGAPFVFDDAASIADNPTLRGFWTAFAPPAGGLTVSGRPLVNASLALNRALGGEAVWGYHAFNLAVHVAAALALFGIVRRTLLACAQERALPLAAAVAVLWAVHPLQTESVTYVVQRAESLMGLLFLLTLYGFIRATDSPRRGRWLALSVAACAAGMATKEVMVAAPLLVLLYDRMFGSGDFRTAWRRRRGYYLALAGTWLLLAALVATAGNRAGTAGVGVGVSSASYALTQCRAIVHYLRLAVWPEPLVFDYGTALVHRLAEVWPQAAGLALLLAATALAVWRGAKRGFLGAWFFAILAPSSSVLPVATQTMAEHRMYLPLAAVVTAFVLAMHAWLGGRALMVCGVLAVAWGGVTLRRNALYRDDVALWRHTVAQRPENARAHNNLGYALSNRARWLESAGEFSEAMRLDPAKPDAYNNLGHDLMKLDRAPEAAAVLADALRLKPDYAEAHHNLADAYARMDRFADAAAHYRAALQRKLDLAETYAGLGHALLRAGRPADAIAPCEQALRLRPGLAATHNDLGIALAQTGRGAEALPHFERAVQLDPAMHDARNNLGNILLQGGRPDEAMAHYRRVLALKPDHAVAHNNLGEALARSGRPAEAAAEFEAALGIDPDYADARNNLARVKAAVPAQ